MKMKKDLKSHQVFLVYGFCYRSDFHLTQKAYAPNSISEAELAAGTLLRVVFGMT